MNKNYKIVTGPESIQGSDAWLKFREDKIGRSDLSSIMKINPWETYFECWERFSFGTKKKSTEAMKRGCSLEPIALAWVNEKLGTKYQPIVLQSTENPYLICSLDGYYEDEEGVHILEIKCPGKKNQKIYSNYMVPSYYVPQTQGQMYFVGVKTMNYLSYSEESQILFPLEIDLELCKLIREKELEFLDSVHNFKPPYPDEHLI